MVAPNGLIASLYGPVEGRRHDAAMLAMSGLMGELEQHSFAPDGEALCIYGDPAYPHCIHLQCPFQQRLNTGAAGFHSIYEPSQSVCGVGLQRDCDLFQIH